MAHPPRQRLAALQLAGFQVSITGRFWVSTEATTAQYALNTHPYE